MKAVFLSESIPSCCASLIPMYRLRVTRVSYGFEVGAESVYEYTGGAVKRKDPQIFFEGVKFSRRGEKKKC